MPQHRRESAHADRFEIRAKLGEGGMGVVYRAWDRVLGKDVALKRVRSVDATRARLLKAEFRARSAVQHRNLVQLYELVADGDDCFFTMELVHGTNLASWVRSGADASPPTEQPLTAETIREGKSSGGETPGSQRARMGSGRSSEKTALPREGDPALDAAAIARLRAALVELCSGLAVLHDAGIVHRDVTPANVRVTPAGRVVLLDFGLASSASAAPSSSRIVIAGTPRYMAPEQVRGEAITAAADLYAVGGILYELLSGRSAFGGSLRSIQVDKAAGERPAPIAAGSADDDLADLALALLDPDPAARPDARRVIERLAGRASSDAPTFGLPSHGAFVGREAEQATIERAFARVAREERPIAVLVEGTSGIGKTTLIKHAMAGRGAALVLASRCHPQETIPFKALDAAMEDLAAHACEVDDLGPFDATLAHAAVRLFPVLHSIPELARHAPPAVPPDDADLRAQGFEALRDLIGRVAARRPVILWIDDVQWDDDDSVALIDALLRGKRAPPMLLLVGLRTASRESGIARRLLDPRSQVPLERIALGPLEGAEIARIASAFLADDAQRIARVREASDGNPFLARELARYLATSPRDGDDDGARDVDGLVEARLRGLTPSERAILVASSLAVRPLTVGCAIAAARLERDARTDVLALRDALLVRQGASAEGETVAPYHDKIAEATARLLTPDERVACHRALAEALEAHEPDDADALCAHWEAAGDAARASTFAFRAAERAAATLAFDRAAGLYEKAIALGFDGVELATLFERAALAHANHGRAPIAARRFLDASRVLGDDVAIARVRTLKRLAAEQYVKSGYVRHGWEVMRSVLDAAGIPQPTSPARATLGALGRRLKFLARRIDVDAIGARAIPPDEHARLEILWTASTSISMVNVTLSDAFRTMHLERILDVGDASSIARALAYEVALEAHVGGPLFDWHAERLLGHARRLVERTRDPYDRAWLALGVANQAYCAGRFRDAIEACKLSESILRAQCSGVAWEITTVAAFLLTSLAMVGDLPALREATERFAADAEHRGDLFGLAECCSGECILAWWCAGQHEDALSRARDAVARQGGDAERWPEKTYRRGQLTELMAIVHAKLLAGDPGPAWTRVLAEWDGLESAMLTRLQFYRAWVRHGRARAAIALAATMGPRDARDGWTRAKLLADAKRTMLEMKKDARPFAAPWAALVEAALAEADGTRDRAIACLRRAAEGFDAAGMRLYREATRFTLGTLAKDARTRDAADAWMRAQGAPDTRALVGALVPGFPV